MSLKVIENYKFLMESKHIGKSYNDLMSVVFKALQETKPPPTIEHGYTIDIIRIIRISSIKIINGKNVAFICYESLMVKPTEGKEYEGVVKWTHDNYSMVLVFNVFYVLVSDHLKKDSSVNVTVKEVMFYEGKWNCAGETTKKH